MPGSFERGRLFARQMAVLRVLDNSRLGLTKKELHHEVQESLGRTFSLKSLERDILFLQQCGFPIDVHQGIDPRRRKIWKMERNDFIRIFQPNDYETLNVNELLALDASCRGSNAIEGTPFCDGLKSLLQKVRKTAPGPILHHFESEQKQWFFHQSPPKDYGSKASMISAMNRSIKMQTEIEITYQKSTSEPATIRLLHPYLLVASNVHLMLIAIEPGNDLATYKHFKLDRIVSVKQMVDQRFKRRDDFDPKSHFHHSLGLYRGADLQTFHIKFSAARAQWAIETTTFPSKKIIGRQADGSLLLEITGYPEEILPRLLGHADQAEILSPQSAREQIQTMIAGVAELYGPGIEKKQ